MKNIALRGRNDVHRNVTLLKRPKRVVSCLRQKTKRCETIVGMFRGKHCRWKLKVMCAAVSLPESPILPIGAGKDLELY